jgi:ribonuclease D
MPVTDRTGDWTFVDDNQGLAGLLGHLVPGQPLFLDTEFERRTTLWPRPALLQLAQSGRVWLVDLTTLDPGPLAPWLADPHTPKVLHACGEDALLLGRVTGAVMEAVLDTQIGLALLGEGASLGYQASVAMVTGVHLDKAATTSDWLRRPLSGRQLRYAADDVLYLPEVYVHVEQRLAQLGRLSAWQEDSQRQVMSAVTLVDPAEAWRNVRGAVNFQGRPLYLLKLLTEWREIRARARDVPKTRLLRDSAILQICEAMPESRAELVRVANLPERYPVSMLKHIMDLLDRARQAEPADWPEPLPRPLPKRVSGYARKARKAVLSRAESLGLAPETLASGRLIDLCLRSAWSAPGSAWTGHLEGWRKPVLVEVMAPVIDAMQKEKGGAG